MKRPRSLFRARKHGQILSIGPQFVGRKPAYQDKVDAMLREHQAELLTGEYTIAIAHDDWCCIHEGDPCCNCNPDVKLAPVPRGMKFTPQSGFSGEQP